MSPDEIVDFLTDKLGICGCSDSDGSVHFVMNLLEAGWMRSEGHVAEADALVADMLPDADCLERNLPIYWLNAAGLLEHGWQMQTYTLSEKGLEVLQSMKNAASGDEAQVDSHVTWN